MRPAKLAIFLMSLCGLVIIGMAALRAPYVHFFGLGLAVIALSVTLYYLYSKTYVPATIASPVTVLDSHILLEFADPEGKQARYKKKQLCQANMDRVLSFVESGLSADGGFGNIRTNNERDRIQVTCDGKVTDGDVAGGRDCVIEVYYEEPKRKGRVFERELELDFLDSFLKKREYFTAKVARPCIRFRLTISAHEERPFRLPLMEYVYEGSKVEMTPSDSGEFRTVRNDEGDIVKLVLDVRQPRLDSSYTVWWEW